MVLENWVTICWCICSSQVNMWYNKPPFFSWCSTSTSLQIWEFLSSTIQKCSLHCFPADAESLCFDSDRRIDVWCILTVFMFWFSAGLGWMVLKINCLAVRCEAHAFRAADIITKIHATLGYFQTTYCWLILKLLRWTFLYFTRLRYTWKNRYCGTKRCVVICWRSSECPKNWETVFVFCCTWILSCCCCLSCALILYLL